METDNIRRLYLVGIKSDEEMATKCKEITQLISSSARWELHEITIATDIATGRPFLKVALSNTNRYAEPLGAGYALDGSDDHSQAT